MNNKVQLWKLILSAVLITALILYFGLYNKVNTKKQADGVSQAEISTTTVKQLSKVENTRPADRIDNTSRNKGDERTKGIPISLVHLLDYVKYPCLPGSNQSKRLWSLGRCIRTVNVQLVADTVKSVECVKLKIGTPIPMCIHDPRIDIYVSGTIFSAGSWEKLLLSTFMKAVNKVKNIVVLDIGCNIGTYTLVAAREGKRVVSIDANVDNLRLLTKSLVMGQLMEKVTLIWNALSDTFTNVSLVTNQFNVGGFSVNTDINSLSGNDVIIETILLDDLIYLFEGRPVGIKMDIEGFELHVLTGGMTFLNNTDVRFIQMEFVLHRDKESGRSIVTILQQHRFAPFASCLGDKHLADLPIKKWPYDVCFIRNI